MLDARAIELALLTMTALAVIGWLISVARRDVSIVDSLWSLFFLLAVVTFEWANRANGPRAPLLIGMVTLWSLRLCGYITWRNHGQPEDRRYQAIRAAHEPGFVWKSFFIVFALQGVLAAIVATPLLVGIGSPARLNIAGSRRHNSPSPTSEAPAPPTDMSQIVWSGGQELSPP